MKYKILQLINPTAYSFMPYDYAIRHGFRDSDYYVVYEGECPDGDDIETLERLFYEFNCCRPANFKGHSLSVSDLIELDGLAYYCNNIGWKAL